MAIIYQIENQDDFLKVVTKGKDENLQEAKDYANAVISAAIQFSSRKILCDERELVYAISIIDTYQLAEFASKYAGGLNKIAIVCDAEYLESGRFYETVASNRGLRVFVTSNYAEALS